MTTPRLILCASLLLAACHSTSGPESNHAVVEGSATWTASTARGRAFEIPDLYRVETPAGIDLSADGEWIVYAVRRTDLVAGKSSSQIYMSRRDGGECRALTAAGKNDSAPQFTPDGKRILFMSTRSGSSQVWTMPVDGGEPTQLTNFGPGVSDPVQSADGRYLAVSASVFPECGIDEDCNKKNAKGVDEGKLKVHVADELLYRHWTSWGDGRVSHVLLVDAASGKVLKDLTPGKWESPTFSLGGVGYALTPDGEHLVYTCNRDKDQASSTNADLWIVPTAGEITAASARNLTADNLGWDGNPVVSPDGARVAFLSQAQAGYESDLKRLSIVDLSSGAVRRVTDRDSFDDMINSVAWTSDGVDLVFEADHRGRTPLFSVPAKGGAKPWQVLKDGTIGEYHLTRNSGIVYTRRTIQDPPEIWTCDAFGGGRTRVTTLNEDLQQELDLRPAQELWIEGEDGYQIHCFVVTPHGFDPTKKYPLVLNVHGGPQSQWSDGFRGDWQVYSAKGYVTAFANPTGSTGYGQDYTDAIARDWGGRVYRDLMRVTDALEELPFVDKDRMGAMGWSYGGYMMMWMQGQTDRFKCQAAMMGLYDMTSFYGATEELWFPEHDLGGAPWESEDYETWSPSSYVKNFKTPALVIGGELDYRVPYTQSLQYFTALQKMGVPSRLVMLPNAGHWPAWHEMAFYYAAHLEWFEQWLGGGGAPWDLLDHQRNRANFALPAK
jgi:dipeptidyl aminopeptidase/acylaminoacyl peptidase